MHLRFQTREVKHDGMAAVDGTFVSDGYYRAGIDEDTLAAVIANDGLLSAMLSRRVRLSTSMLSALPSHGLAACFEQKSMLGCSICFVGQPQAQ